MVIIYELFTSETDFVFSLVVQFKPSTVQSKPMLKLFINMSKTKSKKVKIYVLLR